MPFIINEKGERVKVEMYQAPSLPRMKEPEIVKQISRKVREMPIEKYEEEEEDCGTEEEESCSGWVWVVLLLAVVAIGLGVFISKKRDSTSSSSTGEEATGGCSASLPGRFGFRFY